MPCSVIEELAPPIFTLGNQCRRAIRRGDTAAGLNHPVLAYNHPITIDQEYRPGGCQTTIDGGDIIPRHPVLHCPEPFWKFTE